MVKGLRRGCCLGTNHYCQFQQKITKKIPKREFLVLFLLRLEGKKSIVFYGANVNILVIRVDKDGNYCSSEPCCNCLKFMKTIDKIKINKVCYFDKEGKFVCKKLEDIKGEHTSCGFRSIKI